MYGNTVDQGTSMFFGFGCDGFNPHHHVMNLLGEPIEVLKHHSMYRLVYGGHPIDFHADVKRYLSSLESLFGKDVEGIRRFYDYIADLYVHVISQRSEGSGTIPIGPLPRECRKRRVRYVSPLGRQRRRSLLGSGLALG